MRLDDLHKRAYELCLRAGRYEIIPDIVTMDVATVSGLISYLLLLRC